MIITIDGPAGAGKSTVARIVARRLGLPYLNSGFIYRAVTLLVLERTGVVKEQKKDISMLVENVLVVKVFRDYHGEHQILHLIDIKMYMLLRIPALVLWGRVDLEPLACL